MFGSALHRGKGVAGFLACSLGLCVASGGQTRHRVTFEDLGTIKPLSQINLSPDGKRLAYVSDGDLWIILTTPGTVARDLGKGMLPVWAPDSRHLAYYVTDADKTQFEVLDVMSLDAEEVTHFAGGIDPDFATEFIGAAGMSGDALRYSWSPDSTRLVFSSQVATKEPSSEARKPVDAGPTGESSPLVLTTTTPPDWTMSGIFAHGAGIAPHLNDGKIDWAEHQRSSTANQLFIVDIRTKQAKQLTSDNSVYFAPDWLPDGRHIVCVSMEGRTLSGWGSGPTNLYLVDAITGQKTRLTSDNAYKRIPQSSPDGQWIAFHTQETLGGSSLALVAVRGGKTVNLTAGLGKQPFEFKWSPDSRSLYFTFQDARSVPLAIIDVFARTIALALREPEEAAYRGHITVARTGAISWIQSDGSWPSRAYVLPPQSKAPFVVIDLNPQVSTWELGQQQIVHWKNRRGDDLEGILMRPPNYQEGHKYPLIVEGYPGTVNRFEEWAMRGNQAWASKGYAVFWPAARAPHVWITPYKSPDFDSKGRGPEGVNTMVDDVMSGVDELIKQGIVDENRIGLYGFSNGGAVATQLISKTERFKCAVIVAPAASVDWTSKFLLNTLNKGLEYLAGAAPWEDPNEYIQLSAAYRLDKVTSPTLLADGDADTEFLLSTIELYNGLRWLGRDVTLLRYPNQGHGFEGEALKDFYQRTMTFFDKHLTPTL
jgi:dipeptidyl aminopeptidase/acylaminoacyl peptidase